MSDIIETEFDPRPLDSKTEPNLNVFDLYSMTSNVHSKNTDMTRDYTITEYGDDVITRALPVFIREQRKITKCFKHYMLPSQERLAKFYRNKTDELAFKGLDIERIHAELEYRYALVTQLLIGECDEMIIMSRGLKGEIRTAIITHGRTSQERAEYLEEVTGIKSPKEKLLEEQK